MIKWKTNVFKDLKSFDELTFPELIELYKKQLRLLLDDGYEVRSNEEPLEFNEKKKDIIQFNKIALYKKTEYGRNNITLDLGNKEYKKEFYKKGSFMFYKVPNSILKNMTSHLHQPNLETMNKFHKEVDWDGDWKSLRDEYDERYPKKHKTHKPEEFSWRANFPPVWWFSLRDEGVINPLIIASPKEELFGRGSHRCFMLGKLGYDFPMFLPSLSSIKMLWRKEESSGFITAPHFFKNETLDLHLKEKKVIWYRNQLLIEDG